MYSGSFGSVKLCHRAVGEQPYKQFAMKVRHSSRQAQRGSLYVCLIIAIPYQKQIGP